VGKVEVQPNQGNVIAGAVTLMAEMRSLIGCLAACLILFGSAIRSRLP